MLRTLWISSFLLLLAIISTNATEDDTKDKFKSLVSVEDFYEAAKLKLAGSGGWEYLESGSDAEFTLQQSRRAYRRWVIKPRVLVDVSNRSLVTNILGKPTAFPVAVSPSAMHKLLHPTGECGTAKGAADVGAIFALSTYATCSMEDVAAAAPHGRKWFQLYFLKDRKQDADLIRRAEKAGFEAIVLTVDNQWIGKRRINLKHPIVLPPGATFANFVVEQEEDKNSGKNVSAARDNDDPIREQALTWDIIAWLRNHTKLKIIVKGILAPEDAALAVQYGVDAIVVSNHGGRQLDFAIPTIDALPDIVKAVNGALEVYMDGGALLGTDVFKALALGAKMVFVGRGPLYGLSVAGREGVTKVLNIYKSELDTAMALSGIGRIEDIHSKYLQRYDPL